MDGKELTRLLAKYKEGICTSEEKALLENWVASVTYPEYQITENELEYDLNEISHTLPLARRQARLWPRIAVAAAAVATIVFGAWFYTSGPLLVGNPKIVYQNDVLPGKHTATIKLANGKIIQLNSAKNGVLIDASSLKYNDGTTIENTRINETTMLTTTTPRGGTYQVTLPDGTHVWLNADSKIVFPSKFSGKNRAILLEGEAYFEVAKDKAHPFIVNSGQQKTEVLGTHFNINSYTDEKQIRTTLLEGSVKVATGNIPAVILKPGEEALNNGQIQVEKVNTDEAVAWKNGSIVFRAKTLESIMRELSRWYDVDIIYTDAAPKNITFSGAVSRARNLSTVLERMQTTGSVKFKIEGRTVTVMK